MKIALAPFAATDNVADNIARMGSFLRDARAHAAEYVVFPEAGMHVSEDLSLIATIAEPLDGQYLKAMREHVRAEGVGAVVPLLERDGDAVYNTLVAVDPAGSIVTTYRKVHLYDAFGFRESDYITASAAPQPATFRVGDLCLGLAICYDLRFPESARALVDAGADVVVLPAAWLPGPLKEDHWLTLVRARAIENTCYVVAVNQVPPVGTGGSLVVGPDGVVLAGLGTASGIRVVELERAEIQRVRIVNPALANRRFTLSEPRAAPAARDSLGTCTVRA